MNHNFVLVYLICFVIQVNILVAQKNITQQNLLWYVAFEQVNINQNWNWITEIQERIYINPTAQSQFLIRTHIHRNITNGFESSLGFCYFLQDNNDPYSTDKLTVPELRPHFELSQKQKFRYFSIENRFRTEFRFLHRVTASKKDLAMGYIFGNYRFRYQLQFIIPLFKLKDNQYFKLKCSDEIFFNAGKLITKNIFDQNRISIALNIDILPNLSFDLGYVNWYQQRTSGIDFFNRNILRCAIYHKINLQSKAKK